MDSGNMSAWNLGSSFLSTDTSEPKRLESISGSENAWSGQPLLPQHLRVDFTPLDNVDTEYVQKKCYSFWEFIGRCPEMKGMAVMPELINYQEAVTPKSSEWNSSKDVNSLEPCTRTAISMLEFAEGKGLIDRIFETRLPQSLGSRQDSEKYPLIKPSQNKRNTACKCNSKTCMTCCSRKRAGRLQPSSRSPGVADLCKTMQDWDEKHPKSMDPPTHQPPLHHCAMKPFS